MKAPWIFISCLLFTCSNSKRKADFSYQKIVVIKSDNQTPGFKKKVDTLIFDKSVMSGSSVDVYFVQDRFKIPYYLPTNNMSKDSIKNTECNWNEYPKNLKCYEYDKSDNVIRMKVHGSGAEHDYKYSYNSLHQLVKIEDYSAIIDIQYGESGQIDEFSYTAGRIKKNLQFFYR